MTVQQNPVVSVETVSASVTKVTFRDDAVAQAWEKSKVISQENAKLWCENERLKQQNANLSAQLDRSYAALGQSDEAYEALLDSKLTSGEVKKMDELKSKLQRCRKDGRRLRASWKKADQSRAAWKFKAQVRLRIIPALRRR